MMRLLEIIENSEKVFTYASMSYEKIQQAEKELKVSFSEEYKEYLAEYGVAIFNGHELTGLCDGKRLDVVRITCKEREISEFVPSDWYVVENLDIDGIVIWQNQIGEVFQTSPMRDSKKIANSIAEYVML